MRRDLSRLANQTFDVVVVGAGIYGLATAWELASRELAVAIVDRGDFAGATSFNSLKTIHGGIRALQYGAITEMREFVRDRRAVATMAPHLVRPLPFIVPTYRHPLRNRTVMAAFLAVYDRLAADRNDGLDPAVALPASRTVGRDECLRLNPAIDPAGVTGGALWHDYQLHSPERFALALLHSSVAAGVVAANHVDVPSLLTRGDTVVGVRAHDAVSGTDFDIQSRVVVNATGPWAWDFATRAGVPPSGRAPGFSLAMNLVVDHPPLDQAIGGLVHRSRFLFMVPWRDRSIIGSSHGSFSGSADTLQLASDRVDPFLRDVDAALPRARIARSNVRLVHRGLLPSPSGGDGTTLLKRSIVHDHRSEQRAGLLTVLGVRYTTARATAALAGQHVLRMLGRSGAPARAGPLAGAEFTSLAEYQRTQVAGSGLPADLVVRLIAAYGTRYSDITRLFQADPSLLAPLSPACRVTRAEIVHAVREEMAIHLTDAVLRRTEAGTGGHPGPEAVERAAMVMAVELDWCAERTAQEIASVEEFFKTPS